MKKIVFLLLSIFSSFGFAQDINFFTDVNRRLHQFKEGVFTQIYYQQTEKIFVGNEYICYVDSKGDIYIQYEDQKILFGQSYNDMHVTD
ncbi:MAG: hypothetical protein IT222_00925, partial [Crocinitomix sp.]|nr:hypothetical protein [Crocinitomix sp.]